MESISPADVFFTLGSVVLTLLCVLLGFILYQVFRLVQAVRRVTERVEAGSDQVASDIAHARQLLYNGNAIARVVGFFSGSRRG